ncbi:MAG: transglutaminase domain-containing protein [Odoribacter sp.]|nr:transglutaminase domain-containing protein [Odoribacter sp.]
MKKVILSFLDSIPYYDKDMIEEYKSIFGEVYYNLACFQSVQKKKELAVQSFTKAIANDYINYSHASTDTDLDFIREDEWFKQLIESIRERGDFLHILKSAKGYNSTYVDSLPEFTYLPADNEDLVRVREYFNLDSIAGNGDEISKIKNLLLWSHNVVRHDGSSGNPTLKNAIDLVKVCQQENRGVNCRMMAQLLNECYLAMGFKSRYVTCMPKEFINDCHVINVVYSETLGKWLWVDPTFYAYVTDEKGEMLGIHEVREYLRDGRTLVLNEEANWNNQEKQTKEYYLDNYMAKNLYYVICPVRSEYNTETWEEGKTYTKYVALIPEDYELEEEYKRYYSTSNADYFWANPYKK